MDHHRLAGIDAFQAMCMAAAAERLLAAYPYRFSVAP
jgi:hypothetical protein